MKNVVCISIKQKETGSRIRTLMQENGYAVKDIQEMMGFETPRAVYKWLAGDTLPTVDNLLILSRILHTNMENILVYDGDILDCRNCKGYLTLLHEIIFRIIQ